MKYFLNTAFTVKRESETLLLQPMTSSWQVKQSFLMTPGVPVTFYKHIFKSGTDTVSTFLEWFTLYMVAYPEVQEKFHAEVCSVVGERNATLEDRSATHFAEATILEVMRHCPHLALTIPHYTSDSTTIGGLFIPKDTQVYYYSGAVHHTESIFENHDLFRPERFLDEGGHFRPDERVIYFGSGKRRFVLPARNCHPRRINNKS